MDAGDDLIRRLRRFTQIKRGSICGHLRNLRIRSPGTGFAARAARERIAPRVAALSVDSHSAAFVGRSATGGVAIKRRGGVSGKANVECSMLNVERECGEAEDCVDPGGHLRSTFNIEHSTLNIDHLLLHP
jgi:hypothetical protein